MRVPLRFLVPLLVLAAACTDRSAVTPPVTEPEPEPEAKIIGVYDFTIEGIGTDEITGRVSQVSQDPDAPGSAALNPVGNGLHIENHSWSSVSENARGRSNGHRYISITYRLRNDTGSPVNNITFIPLINNGTFPGTPFRVLRRFDNSPLRDSTIALKIVPTGQVILGDGLRMQSPVQDVLQVYEESEVASIPLPAGVHSLFPYGFVVRNTSVANSRLIPVPAHTQVFDGIVTMSFRVPMPAAGNQDRDDVFGFTIRTLAVQDTETRVTESIEEGADTAAVRRIRARATALGATTVTVLAGSMTAGPTVPNYPGQRQLCSVRTAGTPGAPVTLITAPGPHSDFMILKPGETMDPCAPGFRTGTPGRPATNVAMPVEVRAVDRYGNVIPVRDTVRMEMDAGSPPFTVTPSVVLADGVGAMTVTFSGYGNALASIRGWRILGTPNPIPIAGVTRTWTAGAGTTSWHTGGNWLNGAVPMSLDSVSIPASAPLFPQLAQNVTIRGVTVENGATIALGSFDLTAGANVSTGTSGGINSSVGRLWLTGTAATVQGVLPRLRVTGTYSLTGNVTTVAPARIEAGRLRNERFRVRAVSQ